MHNNTVSKQCRPLSDCFDKSLHGLLGQPIGLFRPNTGETEAYMSDPKLLSVPLALRRDIMCSSENAITCLFMYDFISYFISYFCLYVHLVLLSVTLKCLSIGTLKTIDIPYIPNEKLMFLVSQYLSTL